MAAESAAYQRQGRALTASSPRIESYLCPVGYRRCWNLQRIERTAREVIHGDPPSTGRLPAPGYALSPKYFQTQYSSQSAGSLTSQSLSSLEPPCRRRTRAANSWYGISWDPKLPADPYRRRSVLGQHRLRVRRFLVTNFIRRSSGNVSLDCG